MSPLGPLAGLRVVEISAFIAAPFAGLNLAQLGADVIRIDPIAGNVDFGRWPLAPSGKSIYWASLNKSKRSVSLDLKSEEGQALATAIIRDAGILVTNLPARGWMDYERLRAERDDLVFVELTGNFDGTPAVDYTVNPPSGFPTATGVGTAPVNHVLPAWDIAAGLYLGMAVLAADRARGITGESQKVSLALSDVMLSVVANLGYVADVQVNNHSREPEGNYIYGAFGCDFETADGRRVMIAAMTLRQWAAIATASGAGTELDAMAARLGVDLGTDGGRYAAREEIAAIIEPWFAARSLFDVESGLAKAGAMYGVYRDFRQLVTEDYRCSEKNPMFSTIEQRGLGFILAPRSPLAFGESGSASPSVEPAPELGQNTAGVLSSVLNLSGSELQDLADAGFVNLGSAPPFDALAGATVQIQIS
ncbi:CoA transferase [Arthrobacter sp. SDTb3-6]|uniref:CoA transferase n=1 Tax=Arthrobacter sp. SDTb3-6 TaxID=2713571 RepID=UPI00159D7671|nr:CoA transferase [Arthrobacter sp. SDTb3-6]